MAATVNCPSCGTVLGLPATGMPPDGLPCNWCGHVVTAAPPAAPDPEADPPPPAVTQPDADPRPPRHRCADDDDDNGLPYELPPEATTTRPCASCQAPVPLNAVICPQCGHDRRTKSKVARTYAAVDKSFHGGWPLRLRVYAILVLLTLDFVTLGLAISQGDFVGLSVAGCLFYIVLQTFLVGTYETVRIRRNTKGQVEITSTWRVCFFPAPTKKVDWRGHEGIAFGHYNAVSTLDWILFVMLFLCGAFLAGLLFWWFVIRPDRVYAALTREFGYPSVYLYRGTDPEKARKAVQLASDVTGLAITTPL